MFNITREEMLKKTELLGLKVSVSTLNRYVNAQLITPPKRGHLGVGHGTFTLYHPGSHIELAVAYCCIHGRIPCMPGIKRGFLHDRLMATFSEIEAKDLRHARRQLLKDLSVMEGNNAIKELLSPYCIDAASPDVFPEDEVPYYFDSASYEKEHQYLIAQTGKEIEAEIVKDLTLMASTYADLSTARSELYLSLFSRFALIDKAIIKRSDSDGK